MSHELPGKGFRWVENAIQFNEDFIKSYNDGSDEGYLLEVHVYILETYMIFTLIYHFYLKEYRLRKLKNL